MVFIPVLAPWEEQKLKGEGGLTDRKQHGRANIYIFIYIYLCIHVSIFTVYFAFAVIDVVLIYELRDGRDGTTGPPKKLNKTHLVS